MKSSISNSLSMRPHPASESVKSSVNKCGKRSFDSGIESMGRPKPGKARQSHRVVSLRHGEEGQRESPGGEIFDAVQVPVREEMLK